MNRIFCLLFVVISIIPTQCNSQPAGPDLSKAANISDPITSIAKGLNGTQSVINPANVPKQITNLIPTLFAACESFIKKILAIFTPSTAKVPGVGMATELIKTGEEMLMKPVQAGENVVKGVMKMLSPPSSNPTKAKADTKDSSGDAKPDDFGIDSLFSAFGF